MRSVELFAAEHLAKYPPVDTIDEILRRFLEEMRAVS